MDSQVRYMSLYLISSPPSSKYPSTYSRKATTSLAQRARAALAPILEAQVGTNPRIRVSAGRRFSSFGIKSTLTTLSSTLKPTATVNILAIQTFTRMGAPDHLLCPFGKSRHANAPTSPAEANKKGSNLEQSNTKRPSTLRNRYQGRYGPNQKSSWPSYPHLPISPPRFSTLKLSSSPHNTPTLQSREQPRFSRPVPLPAPSLPTCGTSFEPRFRPVCSSPSGLLVRTLPYSRLKPTWADDDERGPSEEGKEGVCGWSLGAEKRHGACW